MNLTSILTTQNRRLSFATVTIIAVLTVGSASPFSLNLGERNMNDRIGDALTGASR